VSRPDQHGNAVATACAPRHQAEATDLLAGAAGDCIGLAHEGGTQPIEPLVPRGPWRASDDAAIIAAVQCGGDTDTIASIAGQICGAAGGEIPEEWLDRLPDRSRIEQLASALAAVVHR